MLSLNVILYYYLLLLLYSSLLVVQGLTLPLLIRLLKIKPQLEVQKQEENDLKLKLTENVLHYLQNDFPLQLDEKVMKTVRNRYGLIYKLLTKPTASNHLKQEKPVHVNFLSQMLSAQLELLRFERELLICYHKEGAFNDETISKAERELDIEELRLQAIVQKGDDNDLEIHQV